LVDSGAVGKVKESHDTQEPYAVWPEHRRRRIDSLQFMTRLFGLGLLGAALALTIGCSQAAELGGASGASPGQQRAQSPSTLEGVATPGSGIYGYATAAWGNPPANPPSTRCLKVLDSSATKLIATGTCSGIRGDFRVPLAPGRYVVEIGGSWQPKNGAVTFVPNRKTVEVGAGQWAKLAPPSPPGPAP